MICVSQAHLTQTQLQLLVQSGEWAVHTCLKARRACTARQRFLAGKRSQQKIFSPYTHVWVTSASLTEADGRSMCCYVRNVCHSPVSSMSCILGYQACSSQCQLKCRCKTQKAHSFITTQTIIMCSLGLVSWTRKEEKWVRWVWVK